MKNTFRKQENMNSLLKEFNIKNSFNNNKKINRVDTFKSQKIFSLSLLAWETLLRPYQTFKCMKNALKSVQWQL